MKRVREIVVSNVEIEDKFSWWFNTNDSQLYHFTLGKWSTLFGTASPSQDGLMSKEDKEVLSSLSIGSSVVTVPTYADLESYAIKSESILYVVKATNKIYRFYNNEPIEINTFYFNSLEDVKNLQGVGVYYVIVEHETYVLYVSQIGSQLTYTLHSPKKYIECSYSTINSEWSEWVTTNYDAAGAILDIQNWVTAQVAQQNATLSSMQEQITTIANSSTSNFNIFYTSLNSLSLDVTNVKNNIAVVNNKINQVNNTIVSLTYANSNLNTRVFNLENSYASKTWVKGNFATINNLNIASNQISANSVSIQGLTSRVVTLEEAVAALQGISSSYLLKSEADNTYATIGALSSLELQTLNNSDQINLHSILISNLQNNTVTQTDLDIINQQIAGLVSNINSLYEISATKIALNTTNNNLASLETRVDAVETNKADKATTLQGYGILDAYTKAEVDAKVTSVYTYKGIIADYATLLTLENMQVGDVYNLTSTGENYSWTGSAWEPLAGTIDLSAYLEKAEASTIYETKSNVAGLQLIVNANTAAIVDIQESQLEIEEAVSDLTIAQESFLTKVDASTLYTTKTLFNTTADQVILNTSAISSLQTLKADKATTLSGYGITDAVTASAMASHVESNLHLTEGQITKLAGIAAGAEVNVNADWNATTGDAQILNKPNTLTGYGITDVPNDNKIYGRLNGDWSEIDTSGGGGGGSSTISITWYALKFLCDTGTLVPGQSYRITDYMCRTTTANSWGFNDGLFDVVVTALSTNELSENAKAVKHVGDTYFSNNDLNSWEIKYCINNDTSRFDWADTVNGKGVIYYMKDEWGNECAYDFKHIKFKKSNVWLYTFGGTTDDSLTGNSVGNTIKESIVSTILSLNFNTFGTNCNSNTLGGGCYGNTFGNECDSNVFGNSCNYNTFGDGCYSNTFNYSCHSNTFGDESYFNTFGNSCYYNTFGNECYSNEFGNDCFYNTFGNSCGYNTFGNNCAYNNFYVGTSGTTKKDYIRFIVLEDRCGNNNFYSTLTTSGTSFLQRIRIKGLEHTTQTNIPITLSAVNTKYEWVIAKNSSGIIEQYCPDDFIDLKNFEIDNTILSQSLSPNVAYKFTTRTNDLVLTLSPITNTTILNVYYFIINTGDTLPSITWPNDLIWYEDTEPTISINKHYEFSIIDNVVKYYEV